MQITFTKVLLLGFSRKATQGTAKFSAALTKSVCEKMGWGDAPDWQKSSTPAGRLAATGIALEPKPGIGIGKAVEVEASGVDSFEIVRTEAKGKKAKKTKAFKTELLFQVHFGDNSGAKKLEQYLLTCGESTMTVTYEKEAEQEELPGTEAEAEE